MLFFLLRFALLSLYQTGKRIFIVFLQEKDCLQKNENKTILRVTTNSTIAHF